MKLDKMASKNIFGFIFLVICLFTSCTSTININDYIENKSPFILSLNEKDLTTELTKFTQSIINVNSEKHLKLINWFNNNQNGWKATPASYYTEVFFI